MLGRLLLVIHWAMYIGVVGSHLYLKIKYDIGILDVGILVDEGIFAFILPFIIFTTIYWIVKKRWVFFPWQHVKPED